MGGLVCCIIVVISHSPRNRSRKTPLSPALCLGFGLVMRPSPGFWTKKILKGALTTGPTFWVSFLGVAAPPQNVFVLLFSHHKHGVPNPKLFFFFHKNGYRTPPTWCYCLLVPLETPQTSAPPKNRPPPSPRFACRLRLR